MTIEQRRRPVAHHDHVAPERVVLLQAGANVRQPHVLVDDLFVVLDPRASGRGESRVRLRVDVERKVRDRDRSRSLAASDCSRKRPPSTVDAPTPARKRRRPNRAGMMARVPDDHATLQQLARRHLWLHFSRLGAYAERDIPVFVRGEGVQLFDDTGKRYLDGLSGLFVVQIGHGRRELAEAAAAQAERLAYYPIWSAAHPAAIELAARLAGLAPGDLNRVFFTTGGSEAVESAWKLARAYFRAVGQPLRTKVIARTLAYHGTTMGALSITGLAAIKTAFEPLVPGTVHVANTNRFRSPFPPEVTADDDRFAAACATQLSRRSSPEGPETVSAVYLEPVQNTGGCFPPPPGYFARVRAICDRYGVLLVSDEVICRVRTPRRDVRG